VADAQVWIDHGLVFVSGNGGHASPRAVRSEHRHGVDALPLARERHDRSAVSALWLGRRGPLTAFGIAQVLARRSELAGLPRIRPHQLRHTFAHAWLAAGGQAGDLQRLALA
jgi:integrase